MRKTSVVFELADYAVQTRSIVPMGGLEVRADLEPLFGLITIDRTPSNLLISLDEQSVHPPELGVRVPPGRHVVATNDPCYVREVVEVVVGRGERKHVRLAPSAQTLKLALTAAYFGEEDRHFLGEVFVDDVNVGQTSDALTVPACVKRIVVRGPEGVEVDARFSRHNDTMVATALVLEDEIVQRRAAREAAESQAFEERRQAYVQAAIDGHRARVASYEMQREASSAACTWISFPLGVLSTMCGGLCAAGGFLAFYGTGASTSDPMTMVVPVALMTVGVIVGFGGLTEFLLAMTGSGGPCGFGISSLNWAINGPDEPEEPKYDVLLEEAERAAKQGESDADVLVDY